MLKNNQNNKVFTRLIGEVNFESVKEVMKDIDLANNNAYIKEIILTICSYGGLLYLAFALYDHIKASKKPVNIIA